MKEEFDIKNVDDLKSWEKDLINLYKKGYKGLEDYAYKKERDIKGYINWLYKRDREGFFIAFFDDKPVAFIGSDSNWVKNGENIGEIHEIVVSGEFRKRGLGSLLMKTAIERFRNKGLKVCGLWVGEKNVDAIRFYERLGFKECGRWGKWIRMEKFI